MYLVTDQFHHPALLKSLIFDEFHFPLRMDSNHDLPEWSNFKLDGWHWPHGRWFEPRIDHFGPKCSSQRWHWLQNHKNNKTVQNHRSDTDLKISASSSHASSTFEVDKIFEMTEVTLTPKWARVRTPGQPFLRKITKVKSTKILKCQKWHLQNSE